MKKSPYKMSRIVARGGVHKKMPALRWVSIGFDEDTLEQIRSMAEQRKCSFNHIAREMIEMGLETYAENF